MKHKILGILTLTSIGLLVLVSLMIMLKGEFFASVYVQSLMILFTSSVVLSGLYLLKHYCPLIKKNIRIGITGLGLFLILFSILVSFNILDFLTFNNWLIACGILFVLLVQLQLLNWGNKPALLPKIMAFLVIAGNLFLIVYFIAAWKYAGISLWIDIAVGVSMLAFLVGVITTKKVSVAAD